MGRKCIICEEIFGCQRGNIKYLCSECRLFDECSIKHYFSTTHVTDEICPECKPAFEKEQRPGMGISPTPVLH